MRKDWTEAVTRRVYLYVLSDYATLKLYCFAGITQACCKIKENTDFVCLCVCAGKQYHVVCLQRCLGLLSNALTKNRKLDGSHHTELYMYYFQINYQLLTYLHIPTTVFRFQICIIWYIVYFWFWKKPSTSFLLLLINNLVLSMKCVVKSILLNVNRVKVIS